MKKIYRVAGLGEVLWDAFPEGEAFGGAPANFACHCCSLGAEASVISCVGDDSRGAKARDFLRKRGVNISAMATSGVHETGVVLVTLDADGKPEYEIKKDVAWDHIPWSDDTASAASRLDAVCFGSLAQRAGVSRASIEACLAATPPECLRVFDVNVRQSFYSRDIVLSSLERCNALKLNDEELPIVASMLGISGDEKQQMRAIVERCGLRLAVLTRGPAGALMVTPDETSEAASPATTVVSTVGAGDAFTAATVMGFLRNRPLDLINRHANAVAAFVCSRQEAVPELPADLKT